MTLHLVMAPTMGAVLILALLVGSPLSAAFAALGFALHSFCVVAERSRSRRHVQESS